MSLVIAGYSNKDIGKSLQISHRTVEVYRSRVMQKMRARTLLVLADYAKALGMPVVDGSSVRAPSRLFAGNAASESQ